MASDKRPIEQETVRTTIVGGRPPGSGKPLGAIPRGIEVLVKKAAVDPEFKTLLLEKRAEAAREIGLPLDPAETMMLAATPREQLEAIINQTTVSPSLRPAFLGRAAAVMLVALGAGAVTAGVAASYIDQPGDPSVTVPAPTPTALPPLPPPPKPTRGIVPDRPPAPTWTSAVAPTAAAPAVSKADADAIKARIEKEYVAAVLEAIKAHRAGGKPLDFVLYFDAKGANNGFGYFNVASSGDESLAGSLSPLFRSWVFPNLSRPGTATVSITTAEVPAAATPTAPKYPPMAEGARPDRPSSAAAPAAPASSTSKPADALPAAGGVRPDRPTAPLPDVKLISLTVVPGIVTPPTSTPTPAPTPTIVPVPKGIMPDRPPMPSLGIQPDRP
jgi:hypothetical protein